MNDIIQIDSSNLETGALATVTREQTEIQSQIIVAKRFPRNEIQCFQAATKAFERPSLAESACYRFPRGGSQIEGPSVDLAREVARLWKNIRYGLRIVEMTRDPLQECDVCKIKGFAHDMEANNSVEVEDTFKVLIQRKNKQTGKTEWVKPDERDFRELVNRRGAICVRNALLQILPPDVVNEVIKIAKDTLRKAAAGELEQNREDAIRRLAIGFDRLGVTVQMLEDKLGHSLSSTTAEELAEMRQVWKSISDGQLKREEVFQMTEPLQVAPSSLTEKLQKAAEKTKKPNGKQPVVLQAGVNGSSAT